MAAALIFGGLALKQLSDGRTQKTFTAVDPQSMHDHGPDEPCGDSCSKDHVQHDEHPLNIMVSVRTHFAWHALKLTSLQHLIIKLHDVACCRPVHDPTGSIPLRLIQASSADGMTAKVMLATEGDGALFMQNSGAKQHAEVTPEAPLYSMVQPSSPVCHKDALTGRIAVLIMLAVAISTPTLQTSMKGIHAYSWEQCVSSQVT